MPRLPDPEAYRRADEKSMLRKVAQVVEEESAKSLIFTDLDQIPHFERQEIVTGRVVGRGGFGVVRDITAIQLITENNNGNGDSSHGKRRFFRQGTSTGSAGGARSNQKSLDESDTLTTRELLARRVWSRSSNTKYVMKEVEREILQTDRVTYLKGMIDLAMEAKFLASLSHPHALAIRGVSALDPSEDMGYFIILDRLEETLPKRLGSWMQQKRASQGITGALTGGRKKSKHLLTDRILVVYDVADVMNYLHGHNIIYRDLKPDNIGFTADSELKLFDFGLAKELHDEDRRPDGLYLLTGATGAIRYMAPEVGLSQPYNEKADVYSWSMLLWYILALEPPFGMYTPNMFIDRVFSKQYRPAIKEKWPEALSSLMRECWDVNVETRPSFEFIMERLKTFVQELDPEVASFMNASHRGSVRVLRT